MVKVAIVKSSEMDTTCWSALRHTGSCHLCDRVQACKLRPAILGRLVLARAKMLKAEQVCDKARQDLEAIVEEVSRLMAQAENEFGRKGHE